MPRITIYTPADIDTIPTDALKKLAMKTLIYEEKELTRSKLYFCATKRHARKGTTANTASVARRTNPWPRNP